MIKSNLPMILASTLMLIGCQPTTPPPIVEYNSIQSTEKNKTNGFHIMNLHSGRGWNVVVDPDTGCQYINSGMSGYTGMMSPRTAADGVTHMGCREID